jgi:hypothetical protein
MHNAAELDAIIRERERARQFKVEALLKLWSDPDLAGVVEVLKSGDSQVPHGPDDSSIKNFSPPKRSPGSIKQAIIAVAERLPRSFDTRTVLRALQEAHFQFQAKDQVGSVRDALYALTKEARLKLVRKAQGETPNLYEWVKRPSSPVPDSALRKVREVGF